MFADVYVFCKAMKARMQFVIYYKLISPSAAYMRPWIGPALLLMIACRLFGAKPLSEPVLDYCQLDPKEQTSVKYWLKHM